MSARGFNKHLKTPGRYALLLVWLLSLFGAVAPGIYAQEATPTSGREGGEGGPVSNIPDNPYGVNLFLHKEVEEWKIDKTLQMVAEANIAWIKQEFPWQEIEFKKDYFYDDKWNKSAWEKFDRIVEMAGKYNLNITARVDHAPQWAKAEGGNSPLKDYNDLADFINALLDHYEGKIRHVQVWNEPNLSGEWVPGKPVDPAGYAEMMKVVYPAVKREHPDAVIISAPMAMTTEDVNDRGNMNEIDYWQGLYDEGIKGNYDVLSANGYGLDQPPDAPPSPEVLNFRRVELLREVVVENGDGDVPIWFNEYGWNSSPETLADEERNYWRNVTPEQQAEWTVEGIEYARENWPWAGVVNIWYLRQVGDIPPEKAEYYFAMVMPDFTAQPVYDAVKQAAAKYPGPASLAGAATPSPQAAPSATATAAGGTPAVEASPTAGSNATPGAEATVTAGPQPGATVGGESGANLPLLIVGGALVLAGLGALGYYFMKGKGSRTTG